MNWFVRVLLVISWLSAPWCDAQEVEFTVGTVVDRMAFDKEVLQCAPGDRVALVLPNTDHMQHNWVLCRPGKGLEVAKLAWALGAEAVARNYVPESADVLAASAIVNPGDTGRFEFRAPMEKGAYPYVCTLPGHAMSMKGVLYVGIDPPKEAKPPAADFPKSGAARARELKRSDLRHQEMGVLFSGTLSLPETEMRPVYKGIALRVGAGGQGGVVFDPDLMRMAAGWLGNFIELTTREDEKVENRHEIGAPPFFVTGDEPGAWTETTGTTDPRPRKLGPLPRNWAHYRGLYLSGNRALLRYTVGDREVLESPWLETIAGHPTFTRMFEIGPSEQSISIALSEPNEHLMTIVRGDVGHFRAGRSLYVPPSVKPQYVKAYLAPVMRGDMMRAFEDGIAALGIENPRQWMSGGAERWGDEIPTVGELGSDTGDPYVVDTLTLPYENPSNALMYPSGHDFFANGDGAVCMAHGDVWLVRGIDEGLGKLRWKRFATGLSSPLGLKIVNEVIHVTCHDQITKLHDLNSDGVADFYENFNNSCQVTDSHHRFATDLETDAAGNFYYKKCTDEGNSDHGGSVIRVSADGQEFRVFATGLRNPNGMGIGPGDFMTFGNQQGGWVPSSAIHVVQEGNFYGYMPSHHREVVPAKFENPLCWIPHGIDNSCGGQTWVPKDGLRWGPLAGSLLHFSYGQCRMFVVPHQAVGGVYQGAVVPLLNVRFKSSAMRARFRPADGQLYVCGLRGWQTSAELSGAFHRVRYTGKPLYLTTGYAVEREGIRLRFSQAVHLAVAGDSANYQVHQWNYRWTQHYGSKDHSVADPEKQGRDLVEVSAVEVSDDGRSVLLRMPKLKPVMQMQIKAELRAADGQPLPVEVYGTINVIP